MKIIILGAGQVGTSVAKNLVSEANDITVVDSNQKSLQILGERYDLQTVYGHASDPSILKKAGADDSDMIIAVTNSDEVNMIACQVAYTLFHTPTKIARVRNLDYLNHTTLFAQEALPIDVLINPELLVTKYIENLVSYPGSLQVLDFAEGKAQMVAVRMTNSSVICHLKISELPEQFPNTEFRIVTIFREGEGIIPDGETIIQEEDELFIIAAPKNIRTILNSIIFMKRPIKRIIIAGGGNIGMNLAKLLENQYHVKVIEMNPDQAKIASESLKKALVLHGDATDGDLLVEENIEQTDIFCALTNADEANIISCIDRKSVV